MTTGLSRNPDPQDFVGHPVKVESTSGEPAREIPYGMVDSDEDYPCLNAWLTLEQSEKVLRQRLAAGNWSCRSKP